MRDYVFQFPETRFVPGSCEVTRRMQAQKVIEEAAEAFSAAEAGDTASYVSELLDCQQAIETALREFPPLYLSLARREVVMKNAMRGQYPGLFVEGEE